VRKQLLPVGTVLLLACLLALLFQDFLREGIVVPLLYAYWFMRLYVESLPQALLGALFLGVALIWVSKGFLSARGERRRPARELRVEHRGKIETWVERLRLARRGRYFQSRLARRLLELALEAYAYRERTTPEEIRKQVQKGTFRTFRELQVHLEAGLTTDAQRPLWAELVRAPLNPETVVQSLEVILRGTRDRGAHER
jgi:hypothetical protein